MDKKTMSPNPRLEIFYRRMLFNNMAPIVEQAKNFLIQLTCRIGLSKNFHNIQFYFTLCLQIPTKISNMISQFSYGDVLITVLISIEVLV